MTLKNSVIALSLLFSSLVFGNGIRTKDGQLTEMNQILLELETHYGMWGFKEEILGVTLESVRTKYEALIRNAQTLEEAARGSAPTRDVLPVEEFQQLMIALINEFKDGHANITRDSWDSYTVGIRTAAIAGRLFVTGFTNAFYLENTTFPLKVGDEIVAIDGRPVQELAEELVPYTWGATRVSIFHTAMEYLLNRHHMIYRRLKEGDPVRIRFRRKGVAPGTIARDAKPDPESRFEFDGEYRWVSTSSYSDLRARFPDLVSRETHERRPYEFGGRGTPSYFSEGVKKLGLPRGSIVDVGRLLNSQIQEAKKGGAKSDFPQLEPLEPIERLQAWIVESEGKRIGVLRIPSYSPAAWDLLNEVRWLSHVVPMMDHMTDVLVIDHVHNGGGYVYQVVQLLRLFAVEPMPTQAIDMRISHKLLSVLEAWASSRELTLDELEMGLRLGLGVEDPVLLGQGAEASKDRGKDRFQRETRNFARAHLSRERIRELREQFERGEVQTGLVSSFEVMDWLRPNDVGRVRGAEGFIYTKPLLVLNDQRSASGGDFFAAIIQASGRGLVKGETSAALGGPVYRSMTTSGSELNVRCTKGVCYRVDGLPIENVGVVPDLERWIEPSDLEEGFTSYAKGVLAVARMLAEGKSHEEVKRLYREARVKELKLSDNAAHLQGMIHDAMSTQQMTTEDLFALYDLVISTPNLKESDWVGLRLPLPRELLRVDVVLASLGLLDSVKDRLRVMATLPAYQPGGEHAELRPLLDRLNSVIQRLPQGARFEPCMAAFEKRVKIGRT